MKAQLSIGDGPNYRRGQFESGLRKCGYEVVSQIGRIDPSDILVTWNRHGQRNLEALRFEAAGAKVLVAENGYLGKHWNGHKWFALALGHHNGAGQWPDAGPDRWESWNVDLAPFRHGGREVLVLAQRGIGEPGIASPTNWAERTAALIPGSRIRMHPGKDVPAVSLEQDLQDAWCVVTWHSSAALLALMRGVPVFHAYPLWIGREAAKPLSALLDGEQALKDEGARLRALARMSWAMWTDEEIDSGAAFDCLLGSAQVVPR